MKTLLRNARACEGKIITENLFFNGHKMPQFFNFNQQISKSKKNWVNEWKMEISSWGNCAMYVTHAGVCVFLRGTKSWKISRFNQVGLNHRPYVQSLWNMCHIQHYNKCNYMSHMHNNHTCVYVNIFCRIWFVFIVNSGLSCCCCFVEK